MTNVSADARALLAEIADNREAHGFGPLRNTAAERELVDAGFAEYVGSLHGFQQSVTGIRLTATGYRAHRAN